MAPGRLREEDDFILTLSDNDDAAIEDDIVDEEEKEEAVSLKSSKKRKRDQTEKSNRKTKKQKQTATQQRQGKKAATKVDVSEGEENEDDDEEEQEQGEDDGALNSDFEFDVGGNAAQGVIEDFDGWGVDDGKRNGVTAKGSNKKGVDIDEIIARRKARKQEEEEKKKKTEKRQVSGSDEEEDEDGDDDEEGADAASDGSEEDVEEQENEDGPNLDDDELLAPDGFGMGAGSDNEESEGVEDEDSEASDGEASSGGDDGDDDDESVASGVAHPLDEASDEEESESQDAEELAKQKAFFAPEEEGTEKKGKSKRKSDDTGKDSFQNYNLSRPILRGLAAVGFTTPTPIQRKTIPVALMGKDIVGGAVTGSGKTAAFVIPILERLLYRPRKVPTSRVAILVPTRELAVQCYNVATKLATYTDITFCQLVGGFSLREQENVLKKRPDVIIATPGRFIDHMRNSASFTVDTLEILVLDEADRMLDDGFADELDEILKTIPKSRQTMLFSATMTSSVDRLIRVGLNRPVRLMVDAQKQTVSTLVQEFVRLRPGRENKRLGYLIHLCQEVYKNRVIVFFRQKKETHRVRIVFGLFGLKAAELHGSMTQEQVRYPRTAGGGSDLG